MSRWISDPDSGLAPDEVSNERTGIIMGRVGPRRARSSRRWMSPERRVRSALGRSRSPSRCPRPHRRPCRLGSKSRASAIRSHRPARRRPLHRRGIRAHRHGKQDVMFAGGGEELDWTLSVLFDAMGAMSSAYNESPARASRAYDRNRDGFVIRPERRACSRGIRQSQEPRSEDLWGDRRLWRDSDGYDMVSPSGEGAARCMRQAWRP